MRQTSKAVLLLLSAASAGEVDPAWQAVSTATALTLDNQGLWVGFNGQPIYNHLDTADLGAATPMVKGNDVDDKNSITVGTISCVVCIRGKATSRTVWCSAGWNYEYTELALDKVYPTQANAAAAANTVVAWEVTGVGNGTTALKKGDQGFCCYKMSEIETIADVLNDAAGADSLNVRLINKWTCPAKYTYGGAKKKGSEYAQVTISTNNWWCSDGSYNLAITADDTYATAGITATSNQKTWNTTTNNSKKLLDKTKLNYAADNRIRRDELFLQACRQKRLVCGQGSVPEGGTTAQMKRTIVKAATGGFSSDEKCTWTLRSKTKAPTFVIGNTTAAKQLPNTVDVIYQEWVDGWQLAAGVDFTTGYKADGTTAYQQGGVPIAAMANAKYAKAYKWNYKGVANVGSTVEDQTTNNSQRGGEAWVYQSDVLGCVPAALPAADKNNAAATRASCLANNTKKRWINLDVSGATYLNAVADNYASKLTTFNSDATSYNTYLADLKTANEKDAFSAFFSPPKKPAMVKRPGAPTTPATYTGLQHWPATSQTLQLKDGSGFPTTDGMQFVLGNNQLGGWGAWTISRLVGGYQDAATNLISHSFGMLGTSQGTTVRTGWSYAKQWQKDNVTTMTTTAQLKATFTGVSNTGGLMCTTAATTASHACLLSNAGTAGAVNSAYAYLNVSVWTNSITGLTAANWNTAAHDPYVQFYASAWADGKAYYAPAAAAAATALSEPAGAQALAASAAAVLAVAAALY